jgi:hypothetical protein
MMDNTLEKIFEIYFSRGEWERAIKAAELLEEPYRSNKLIEVVKVYLEKDLEKALEVVKLIPPDNENRGRYAEIIAEMYLGFMKESKRWFANKIIETLRLMSEDRRRITLERMLKEVIKEGWLEFAQMITEEMGRSLRKEELEAILKKTIENERDSDYWDRCQKIARLIGRNLTLEELRVIFERILKFYKEDMIRESGAAYLSPFLFMAVEVAKNLPPEDDGIGKIIVATLEIEEANYYGAQDARIELMQIYPECINIFKSLGYDEKGKKLPLDN